MRLRRRPAVSSVLIGISHGRILEDTSMDEDNITHTTLYNLDGSVNYTYAGQAGVQSDETYF